MRYIRLNSKKTLFLLAGLFTVSSLLAQVKDTLNAPPPVLPGVYADPNIAVFGKKFYIYPTTDGTKGWLSTSFTCWSSDNLKDWKNEGVILDLPRDLTWAKERAWAPTIAFKNGKYYYYYSANVNIGVAVADKPTGPFTDPLGKPLIAKGTKRGQMIDPMTFVDDDGSAYLYWGQGQCNVVQLNTDMTSCDTSKIASFKPPGYNEGPFMIKRKGVYYLMWSEYDTRDPRYSIAYATSNSPLGPFKKAEGYPVLKGKGVVKGAGHHSVVQVPGKDEWYIAYHRFKIPDGDGYNRETCVSPMRFDAAGNIMPVDVFERVKPLSTLSGKQKVTLDTKALTIPAGYTNNLRWDLPLDSVGANGLVISWKSGNTNYIANNGKLVKYSPLKGKKVQVTMTATLSAGGAISKKSFVVTVACPEQQYQAYLFTYFEGSGPRNMDEQLRFGVSADATNWVALNSNQPVVNSDTISGTGGIRDPHILRCEDGKSFYLVATDMSTAKNGWGHNPGIVMLRSGNLTSWKHAFIDLEKAYPTKFANVQWVWAPQTIYDPAAGKYMVYFTVKYKDDLRLDFYSGYANKDFSGFESEPKLLFHPKYGAIDGDIIYKDGTYHFFFKGNTKDDNGKEIKNGIRQATSKTLQGPWAEQFQYLDAYSDRKIVVEGSSVFKLNNSDTYVLMYDLYTNHRYEFQRSKDLYTFTQTPESFTKNFYPRHGTAIGITLAEAKLLNQKWGGVPEVLLKK